MYREHIAMNWVRTRNLMVIGTDYTVVVNPTTTRSRRPLNAFGLYDCRYILDQQQYFKNKNIVDIGSGCGASAIACKMAGARKVLANDIDEGNYKLLFILNIKINATFCCCKMHENLITNFAHFSQY